MNPGISIIITTIKEKAETLHSLGSCPVSYEVIISRVRGISRARNEGGEKASGDLLVFFDDDLVLSPKIWSIVLSVEPRSFLMAPGFEPGTRVFCIHRKDFIDIGGFDEKIEHSGEDRELWLRLYWAGYHPYTFNNHESGVNIFGPKSVYTHMPHPIRSQKKRINRIKTIWEQSYYFAKFNGTRSYNFGLFSWLFQWKYFPEWIHKRSLYLYGTYGFWYSLRVLFLFVQLIKKYGEIMFKSF